MQIRVPNVFSPGFNLFRSSKSKSVVNVCSNTLRVYNKQGLPFDHQGRVIFLSKTELAWFIIYSPRIAFAPGKETTLNLADGSRSNRAPIPPS